jgi:hypothetical protein
MKVFRIAYLFTLLQTILTCHAIQGQTGNDSLSLYSLVSIEFDDWKMIDQPKLFVGEQLFSFIDGGADIYMEFGFDKVLAVKYSNNAKDIIQVEIYEMIDNKAAYGIFTSMSSPKGIKVDYGLDALFSNYYLIFWKGSYYVTIIGNNTKQEVIDGIKKIGKSIDEEITCTSEKPELINLLSLENVSFDDIKYMRGNIALDSFYIFDVGDVLGIREAVAGKNEQYILMVIKYNDPKESLYWLNSCKSRLKGNPKYLDFDEFHGGFITSNNYSEFLRFEAYNNCILIMICSDKHVLEPTIAMLKNRIDLTIP